MTNLQDLTMQTSIDVSFLTNQKSRINVYVSWDFDQYINEYLTTTTEILVCSVVALRSQNMHLNDFEFQIVEMAINDIVDTDYYGLKDDVLELISKIYEIKIA